MEDGDGGGGECGGTRGVGKKRAMKTHRADDTISLRHSITC